jgi:tetratricopeptide (TPR) repeat protein
MKPPPTAGAPSPRPAAARRRWRVAFGTLVLVLAVLALGLGWWWRWRVLAVVDPPMPAGIEDPEVCLALERARQRVVQDLRSANAWGDYGLTLLAQLFDAEADLCLVQAARLEPSDGRWTYGRAMIALKRRPDEAVPLLREAEARTSGSGTTYDSAVRFRLAETLLERGAWQEAEQLFQTLWRQHPGDPRAALGLGRIAREHGDRPDAVKYLNTARRSPFARKTATVYLAALARAAGEPADAYEEELATLPEDPAWPDPFMDRVRDLAVGRRRRERQVDELEREQRYAEAAEVWLEQVAQAPTAQAYVGAGVNVARLGDYERALPLLRQALRLNPDSAQAHYTLALVLFTRTEKQWQHSPDSAECREWLREVVEHARRAVELKPDYAMAYLFWGLALKYLGRPEEAIEPLRRGVTCRPDSFELQLALGEVLLASGHTTEAETHLENARRLDAKDPRPIQALRQLRNAK